MQTHDDMSHVERMQWLESLKAKAEKMESQRESQITGGKPGEKPLAEWKCGGVCVKHLPDDEHGILRISCGGGRETPIHLDYCVIRGSVGQCIELLQACIVALRAAP